MNWLLGGGVAHLSFPRATLHLLTEGPCRAVAQKRATLFAHLPSLCNLHKPVNSHTSRWVPFSPLFLFSPPSASDILDPFKPFKCPTSRPHLAILLPLCTHCADHKRFGLNNWPTDKSRKNEIKWQKYIQKVLKTAGPQQSEAGQGLQKKTNE